MKIVYAIVLATASLLIMGHAEATLSCSERVQRCIARPDTRNPQSCVANKAACMRTGRWIGPESGYDYGPAERR